MSDIVIQRGEDGRWRGVTDADERRFARWRSTAQSAPVGDTLKFTFKIPRSPGFHRRHFAILARVFSQQEQFEDPERFRLWLQTGAGFCDILPGPKGKPVAISRSIAWEALEDADFAEHHAAVIAFLRSTYCTRFLWPEWSDLEADTFINSVLAEFGA